jgi:hypothetical protein
MIITTVFTKVITDFLLSTNGENFEVKKKDRMQNLMMIQKVTGNIITTSL